MSFASSLRNQCEVSNLCYQSCCCEISSLSCCILAFGQEVLEQQEESRCAMLLWFADCGMREGEQWTHLESR